MADHGTWDERISGIASLDQPLRRDLYRLLGEHGGWVGREDAARALGLARSVAAFHLDKLADAGLLEVRFERTSGRTGPGAGRPAKLYRRAQREVVVAVPDRHYRLAASIFVDAVATATRTGRAVAGSLRASAEAAGRELGQRARRRDGDMTGDDRADELLAVLSQQGYEPVITAGDEIAMANCPFHLLADQERELVCGMNLELINGVIDELDLAGDLAARLQPEPGLCCVRVVPTVGS